MAEITSDILAKIAPGTAKPLRDRFLPYFNEALPRYGIVSEFQVAGFLATACFESDHFKTLREYGKGAGRAYGKPDPVTGLIYYGRGIFQNTWKRGYKAFTDYVRANWRKIPGATGQEDFVLNPELLATPFWAVEAACWYWQRNGLDRYAKQGLKGFFGLQGMVNRGSASKQALDYPDRLAIYEAALRYLPDAFNLVSAADPIASPEPTVSSQTTATGTVKTVPPIVEPSPTVQSADTIVNTGDIAPPTPPPTDVTIAAPVATGTTAQAAKVTLAGVTVPPFLLVVWGVIQSVIDKGFVSSKQIGDGIISLVSNNAKYVLITTAALIGIFLLFLIFKRVERLVIFVVSMITAAIPKWNTVTVEATNAPARKWWQIF